MEADTSWLSAGGIKTQKIFHVRKPEVTYRKQYLAAKRAFDFFFSFTGLIILFIPMLLIAAIIKIDSPGEPIYKQERLGINGMPFLMYKFRTMRDNAEEDGPRWADEDDERCTRFGRLLRKMRIDEWPQLYNILKGEMSFVGPRPERKYFYDKFEKYIIGFSNRLLVKPGLTGYAQVYGGCFLEPEEKIVYDIEYIEKRSFMGDIKCILKTVPSVLKGGGKIWERFPVCTYKDMR